MTIKKHIPHAAMIIGAVATISCASSESVKSVTEPAPFIDPLIIAQNLCRGPANNSLQLSQRETLEKASDFEFSEPYRLAEDTVAHFHFPISTENEDAQFWFDNGLAHMANFNHDEAIASFRKAYSADPNCVMCLWGEGLSFGSNINAPFNADRGAAGLVASLKALSQIDDVSGVEAALIRALSNRYALREDGAVLEQAERYADEMKEIVRLYPDNKFVLSLSAEANMNTQPWNYWEDGGLTPIGRTEQTIEWLEKALAIDPDYAPAIHLYIHATEASVDPFRAESFADRLAEQSLGVGHLVHMPSHIYFRLGRWRKSQEANLAAIADDERYIDAGHNSDYYARGYYPHNIHFVIANAQAGGDKDTALSLSEKLKKTVDLDDDEHSPFGEHRAAAPLYAALQFGDYDAVLAMSEPADAHLLLRIARHYARGMVLSMRGFSDLAQAESAVLEALKSATELTHYDEAGLPLTQVLDVASLTLEGRLYWGRNEKEAAIAALEEAARIQDNLSYMEPGWWYYPTRQTLGAYLLKDGQAERAEREFYRTLIKSPNNAYALFGLAQAYKAQGNIRSEDYAQHLFRKAWIGSDETMPDLDTF